MELIVYDNIDTGAGNLIFMQDNITQPSSSMTATSIICAKEEEVFTHLCIIGASKDQITNFLLMQSP